MIQIEKTPKVSVCVITYNQEKYIRQCLQSIVNQQTDYDFEVIVGDDCSTDDTRLIVQEFAQNYPQKIRIILQENNTGGTKNYLDVHAAACGKYVAHIDGDDLMFQGKLEAQSQILDSDPACTAVWHRVDFFDDAGGYCSGNGADLSPFSNGTVHFEDAIRLGYVSVHSSLMYRRSSARNPELSGADILDVYRTWDLLSSGSGYILNDVLGAYRVSATGSISANSHAKMSRLAIEHAKHFLKTYPEKREAFFLFSISNAIINAKNIRLTTFCFLKFAIRIFVFVSPQKIISNLRDKRRIQVPWKKREQRPLQEK